MTSLPHSGPAGAGGTPRSHGAAISPEVVPVILEAAPRVVVIGDLILDEWWNGHSERISREAPAPVVDVTNRVYAPGGAANTAMNLAALGARVSMVGLVGADDAGATLLRLLSAAGIDVDGVLTVPARTATKIRIVSDDHVLVRVDEAETRPYAASDLEHLAAVAVERAAGADAELVCDYGFGTLRGAVLSALSSPGRRRPPLTVVDAHDPTAWLPLRPHLITPNAKEAARVLALDALPGPDRAASAAGRAADLLALTGAESAVVTLDRDGTVVLRADGEPHRTFAHPALETRASGAGDTFVAGLTVARASGLDLVTSAEFAQLAADVVVQRYGTSVCTLADVAEQLGAETDLSFDHDRLERELQQHRDAGRRIVFTNGCFDVLHRGHTTYLAQAKRLGDVLVVAINADESVRRLKGEDRPVNAAEDRANVLAALGSVDYVTVFEADTPSSLLERLRPDVYVKGGDTPEMLEETPVVTAYGGEVRMLGYVPAQSTTAMVARIRASGGTSAGG
jgi:D-beta-D-heptose 7-phosphate kinase/D-beta-D-heptose 1-phosphate adenosyltransferase